MGRAAILEGEGKRLDTALVNPLALRRRDVQAGSTRRAVERLHDFAVEDRGFDDGRPRDVRFLFTLHDALPPPGRVIAASQRLAPGVDVATGVVLAVAGPAEGRDAPSFFRRRGQVVDGEIAPAHCERSWPAVPSSSVFSGSIRARLLRAATGRTSPAQPTSRHAWQKPSRVHDRTLLSSCDGGADEEPCRAGDVGHPSPGAQCTTARWLDKPAALACASLRQTAAISARSFVIAALGHAGYNPRFVPVAPGVPWRMGTGVGSGLFTRVARRALDSHRPAVSGLLVPGRLANEH